MVEYLNVWFNPHIETLLNSHLHNIYMAKNSKDLDSASRSRAGLKEQLFLATLKGELRKVKYILGKGVDVNAKDERGRTALMYARWTGNNHVAELLRRYGAKEFNP